MFSLEPAARPAEREAPEPFLPASELAPRRTGALLRRVMQVRFIRFLLVAALNTVFGYSLFAAMILAGIHYPLAAAIGTVIGILFNFQTTGRLVFERHDPSLILRFFGVYGISYIVGVGLLRWADHHDISVLVAAAVLAVPMGLFSYTLQRLLVFRKAR
jgi:putative flippase GtrA